MISKGFNEDILKEKIGLAGCGNMGLPMLNSMLSKNIDAKGYDIERKTSLLALGKEFVTSKKKFLGLSQKIGKLFFIQLASSYCQGVFLVSSVPMEQENQLSSDYYIAILSQRQAL